MVGRTYALLSIVKRQTGDTAGRHRTQKGPLGTVLVKYSATCTGKGNLFFNVRVCIVPCSKVQGIFKVFYLL